MKGAALDQGTALEGSWESRLKCSREAEGKVSKQARHGVLELWQGGAAAR